MEFVELYRKPIEKISFDDIRQFCAAQHREHVLVDYKRAFSSRSPGFKIAKVVASFANTQGGIIIFGVEELEDGVPEPAPNGQNLGNDPRTTVRNACAQLISPPITVAATTFIENPSDRTRGFLVVRVPLDKLVHTVDNFVYIRVMDSSEPRAPSLDLMTALLDRRKGLEDLEEERRTALRTRIEWIFHKASIYSVAIHPNPPVGLWVTVGPRFGVAAAIELERLGPLVGETAKNGTLFDRSIQFPPVSVQDGLMWFADPNGKDGAFGVDVFGNTVLYDRTIVDEVLLNESEVIESQHQTNPNAEPDRFVAIRAHMLADSLLEAVAFGHSLNAKLGWRGPLKCVVTVTHSMGLPLVGGSGGSGLTLLAICRFDEIITQQMEIEHHHDPNQITEQLFRQIVWAWGRRELLTIQQTREMSLRF